MPCKPDAMPGGWAPDEWWDSIAGEPGLGKSPERPILQSYWSCWADHQEDCFALSPLCFPEDEAPSDSQSRHLSDLSAQRLEDLYYVPCALGTPKKSTAKLPFKDSFENRSPAGISLSKGHPPNSAAPRTPGQSLENSTQSGLPTQVFVDLQLAADEGSESVTCTITGEWDDSRRATSGKDSTGTTDEVSPTLLLEGMGIDSKSVSSEHEGDSQAAGLPAEVDLQCKGEQLSMECEEDSGVEAGVAWMHTAGGCMGFIPVSNSVLLETSSHSTDGPSTTHSGGKEESAETEGAGTSHEEHKGLLPAKCGAGFRDESGESPASSGRESALSEGTRLLLGLEGKRRISKPGKLAEAASVNDMTIADACNAARRRPGRPSKPAGHGNEARAPSVKRKRATTSKPAAPAVSGQACTQCFTHVTPVWRAGPEGPKTLCNACGVRYMKVAKRK